MSVLPPKGCQATEIWNPYSSALQGFSGLTQLQQDSQVWRNPGVWISGLRPLLSGELGWLFWMVPLYFLFFCPPATQSIWDSC